MELKRTPLYNIHKSLGAKFVGFAGWEMPVQYAGVIEEHLGVRSSAGLFDVSHMGEIEVKGPGALKALQRVLTNDLERITEGQCQYTLICYPDGGVVDDCIVYRFSTEKFLICVNASNTDKAFDWIKKNVPSSEAEVANVSASYAQIALQGPSSVEIMKAVSDKDPALIRTFHFTQMKVAGEQALVSRTGYTGEDGFEIYTALGSAEKVWSALMAAGKAHNIMPIGLGARDTLRLEMGYPLYGHELSEKITPIEAGLKKYVSLKKQDFIGKGVLEKQDRDGVTKTLVAFEMLGPEIPRADYEAQKDGRKIGFVASGTMSPSLKKGVGTAFVEPGFKEVSTELDIVVRKRAVKARVVKLPFYRRNP